MEAIILAGGQATRMGDATRGHPKALVPIAGHPLAEYQVSQLVRAGVERVIVSCGAGQARLFEAKLSGLGAEIVAIAEPEPLGRGGGIRFAADHREETGPLYAFNGDELHDVDLRAFLDAHEEHGGAATIVVAPLTSQFGVVDLADDNRISGFREAPRLPHWVNAGVYVLDDEALARLPERGDHEQSTFPELAEEGKLFGFRHEGLWITVNTPKDLQRAEEHYAAHPELRPTRPRAHLTQKAGVRPVPFGSPAPLDRHRVVGVSVDSPNLEGLDSWAFEPRKVDKPWGHELIWAEGDRYAGKVLFVKAGESLSLQFHRVKEESWLVQAGRAKLELGSAGDAMLKEEVIAAGACFHFRPGTVHRVTAIEDTTIVEVSTPELDDVVRLEDRYGREGTSEP